VIEDAAHAVDSRHRGVACGAVAQVGIYSFDAVKNLTTGTGGGLTCRDPERAERARRLRYCGIGRSGFEAASDPGARWWEHHCAEPFLKMLPTDLAAGIGLAQLAKLDAHQAHRAALWARYEAGLAALPWVERPPAAPPPGDRHSWFTYLVRVRERDRLARYVLERGVYPTFRFPPLHRAAPYRAPARLPVCEDLAEHGLNLPPHPRLAPQDAERIVALIADFGTEHGL
jgi:aminotransferase